MEWTLNIGKQSGWICIRYLRMIVYILIKKFLRSVKSIIVMSHIELKVHDILSLDIYHQPLIDTQIISISWWFSFKMFIYTIDIYHLLTQSMIVLLQQKKSHKFRSQYTYYIYVFNTMQHFCSIYFMNTQHWIPFILALARHHYSLIRISMYTSVTMQFYHNSCWGTPDDFA